MGYGTTGFVEEGSRHSLAVSCLFFGRFSGFNYPSGDFTSVLFSSSYFHGSRGMRRGEDQLHSIEAMKMWSPNWLFL